MVSASDSGARGRGFDTYLHSTKVLVIPMKRWLRPDMTDKLFTGTLSNNETKTKNKNCELPKASVDEI